MATHKLSMLDRLARVGVRIHEKRRWLWSLVLVLVLAFGAIILTESGGGDDESHLLGLVSALLWTLSVLGFGQAFASPLVALDAEATWFARMLLQVRRGGRWIVVVAVFVLFVLAIAFTARAIGIA